MNSKPSVGGEKYPNFGTCDKSTILHEMDGTCSNFKPTLSEEPAKPNEVFTHSIHGWEIKGIGKASCEICDAPAHWASSQGSYRCDEHAYPESSFRKVDPAKSGADEAKATWAIVFDDPATSPHVYRGDGAEDKARRKLRDLKVLQVNCRLLSDPSISQSPLEPAQIQWWLATLDAHGNPTLTDGSHSNAKGCNHAAYLIKSMNLPSANKPMAVAKVELFDCVPDAEGANEEAIATVNSMRKLEPAQPSGETFQDDVKVISDFYELTQRYIPSHGSVGEEGISLKHAAKKIIDSWLASLASQPHREKVEKELERWKNKLYLAYELPDAGKMLRDDGSEWDAALRAMQERIAQIKDAE